MSELSCGLILLAAGESSRMGSAKQLLDYRGKPLVRHGAETALASGCHPVIVVLGARASEIEPALNGLAVETVLNSRWREGMGTSIQAGLGKLGERSLGAILALADQPLVTAEILRGLLGEHRSTGRAIVAASYSGTVGVPVFFARSQFGNLLALRPAEGCKRVILEHRDQAAAVDCPEAAADVDTLDDYRRLIQQLPTSASPS